MTEIPEGEPVRWLDDAGADAGLRADLAHGAGAVATGVDYAATLSALRSAMTAATGPVATTAAAATSSTMGFKVGVAAVALAGAAAWWLGTRPIAERPGTTVAAVAPTDETNDDDSISRSPTPVATPAAKSAELRAPATSPAVVAPVEPVVEAAPVVAPTVVAPTVVAPAVDDATDRRPKRPIEGADEDDDRFVREAKLVATARKQLADDPTAALASTRRHSREFPRGVLVEESDAIEIRALAQLGKTDEAERKAAEFLKQYSDGPHAAAVRRALE